MNLYNSNTLVRTHTYVSVCTSYVDDNKTHLTNSFSCFGWMDGLDGTCCALPCLALPCPVTTKNSSSSFFRFLCMDLWCIFRLSKSACVRAGVHTVLYYILLLRFVMYFINKIFWWLFSFRWQRIFISPLRSVYICTFTCSWKFIHYIRAAPRTTTTTIIHSLAHLTHSITISYYFVPLERTMFTTHLTINRIYFECLCNKMNSKQIFLLLHTKFVNSFFSSAYSVGKERWCLQRNLFSIDSTVECNTFDGCEKSRNYSRTHTRKRHTRHTNTKAYVLRYCISHSITPIHAHTVKSTRTFVVRLYFDVSLFENPPSLSTLIHWLTHSLTRCAVCTCLFVSLFVCLCARNVQVRVSIHCCSCVYCCMAAFVMYSMICVSQPLTLSFSAKNIRSIAVVSSARKPIQILCVFDWMRTVRVIWHARNLKEGLLNGCKTEMKWSKINAFLILIGENSHFCLSVRKFMELLHRYMKEKSLDLKLCDDFILDFILDFIMRNGIL